MVWRIFWNKDYTKINLLFPFFEVFPLCIHFFSCSPIGVQITKKLNLKQYNLSPNEPAKSSETPLMNVYCGLCCENFSDGRGMEGSLLWEPLYPLGTVLPDRDPIYDGCLCLVFSPSLCADSHISFLCYKCYKSDSFVWLSQSCTCWKYFSYWCSSSSLFQHVLHPILSLSFKYICRLQQLSPLWPLLPWQSWPRAHLSNGHASFCTLASQSSLHNSSLAGALKTCQIMSFSWSSNKVLL